MSEFVGMKCGNDIHSYKCYKKSCNNDSNDFSFVHGKSNDKITL